ncbi:UDP-N-acetylglucosamine 2-epimerase [compost metagenome]
MDSIAGELARLLTDEGAYREMSVAHNPYGDGKACGRIVQTLADFAVGQDA